MFTESQIKTKADKLRMSRGVKRCQTSFCKNCSRPLVVDYFHKKLHLRCLTGFWIHLFLFPYYQYRFKWFKNWILPINLKWFFSLMTLSTVKSSIRQSKESQIFKLYKQNLFLTVCFYHVTLDNLSGVRLQTKWLWVRISLQSLILFL